MKTRKINATISICLTAALLFVGCSVKNINSTNETTNTATEVVKKQKSIDAKEIRDLMQKINSEKQVSGIEISTPADGLTAVIKFKSDADNKNVKQFSEKYGKLIKDVYGTKNVKLKIFQNEKNIFEVTI